MANELQKKIKVQKKQIKKATKDVIVRSKKYASAEVTARCITEMKPVNKNYKAKIGLECVTINNDYLLSLVDDLAVFIGDFSAAKPADKPRIQKQIIDTIEDIKTFTRVRETLVDARNESEAANRNITAILEKLSSLQKELKAKNEQVVKLYQEFQKNPNDAVVKTQLSVLNVEIKTINRRTDSVNKALKALILYMENGQIKVDANIATANNVIDTAYIETILGGQLVIDGINNQQALEDQSNAANEFAEMFNNATGNTNTNTNQVNNSPAQNDEINADDANDILSKLAL